MRSSIAAKAARAASPPPQVVESPPPPPYDLATAQILDAEDFKEIGIKVGTRKKLLERLASSTSEA